MYVCIRIHNLRADSTSSTTHYQTQIQFSAGRARKKKKHRWVQSPQTAHISVSAHGLTVWAPGRRLPHTYTRKRPLVRLPTYDNGCSPGISEHTVTNHFVFCFLCAGPVCFFSVRGIDMALLIIYVCIFFLPLSLRGVGVSVWRLTLGKKKWNVPSIQAPQLFFGLKKYHQRPLLQIFNPLSSPTSIISLVSWSPLHTTRNSDTSCVFISFRLWECTCIRVRVPTIPAKKGRLQHTTTTSTAQHHPNNIANILNLHDTSDIP